jgi:hypothetical protein
LRIARETQSEPGLPRAFKRAEGDAGPDEVRELTALWHKARVSLLKSRQHLLNEAEAPLTTLPDVVRGQLPGTKNVRARLRGLGRVERASVRDEPTLLRLRLLDEHARSVAELDGREREASAELGRLTAAAGSTLSELCGIADRCDAELLVEAGDPRRFAGEGGFARFNGTAPLPASSAEGDDEPVRHRLNRGGTGGSTLSCTAWRSRSSAATDAPAWSSMTRGGAATRRKRPCESSNATSATSSIAG